MSVGRIATVMTLGVFAATVGGCASVQAPDADLATGRVGAPARFSESVFEAGVSGDDVASGWLATFEDPVLDALVREAWANNPDLYVTAARFEEAAASLRVAASLLYPQVLGTGGTSYTSYDGSDEDDAYAAGLRVTWEMDLWGRLRANREASRSVAESAGLDFIQARHSLAAAVAEAYFGIAAANEQLRIDRLLLEAEQFTAVTTGQRVDAGLGTSLDADLAESNVRLAEAAVQDDLAALRESRRAMELLLGRYPSAELERAPAALPALPGGAVAVGVPTELLERRPDIRAAEALVDSAYYRVESARAARLPSLILSSNLTQIFDPASFIATVAADILAPLFQGGRLQAAQEAATARQRQTLGRFASVALRAFEEVETALSNERYLRLREESLAAASERLVRAGDTAISRYDQGLLTILDLQQVRRSDYSTRSLLLSVRFEQLRQRLNLYLALGGPVFEADATPGPVIDDEMLDRRFVQPDDAPISGELRVGVGQISETINGG